MSDSVEAADDVEAGVREFVRRAMADSAALSGGRDLTPAERRAIAEEVRKPWRSGGPEMAETRTVEIGGTRVRLHRPVRGHEPLPALVYVHGGGWTVFSLDTHDRLMREYAARTGCVVAGVDYSLSPEARYPTALEEVGAVLDGLADEGEAYGVDPMLLAVGGDSAGGNLALASALRSRDRGGPVLSALLLNYGAFDTVPRPSYARYGGDAYMLTAPEMEEFWVNYLGSGLDRADPLARPILGDFQGLPPTFLCIAECDILADENREVAARMAAAGVAVNAVVYPGATHSFLEAVSVSPLAERALAEASDWLRRQLRG